MFVTTTVRRPTFQERIDALRAAKLAQTLEKQQVVGSMDHDDWALVLPPPDRRKVVKTTSSSGMPITDVLLEGFQVRPNHPGGGFFGPKACGANFRALLESQPPYVDPNSSLAGAYVVNFMSYRRPHWNPDLKIPEPLQATIRKYQLGSGIGATQHFCQDLQIGLDLGWGGILENIRRCRRANVPRGADFYDGLEDVVLGMQNWIGRTADEAARQADQQVNPHLRRNLLELAEINRRLTTEPPRTFRDACQWMLWYDMAARMYNGSGSLGRLDVLLTPYYQRESAAGSLSDEEATFHVACLLLRDTAYIQLGGPDAHGNDVTNRVSFLVLEAAHWLKIPANIGVSVGRAVDPDLLRRGVEMQFSDKTGIPKFLGAEQTAEGFARNGYPIALGRQRAYSGCHWLAIPGREYTLNDCVKLSFGPPFDLALREMLADESVQPSVGELWKRFERHMAQAVRGIAGGLDFHLAHMQEVFPELVMDLLCHGPIEKGLDASAGGVEYYNLCCDAVALATIADSFAAVEQRVEQEKAVTWRQLLRHLDEDWAGAEGQRVRLMMRSVGRFGSGGSRADEWAVRISRLFTRLLTEKPTPGGRKMIPGIFSWANTITFGASLGATPNGRGKGAPISHGPNPDPGFRKDGAPTALAAAVAAVQCGRGNTCPMQMELDPGITAEEGGVDLVSSLIRTHFDLGGTQINLNIVDKDTLLAAHADPGRFPDLVVRVTGFSAYFASLSREFRQLIVDRILAEA